MGPRTSRVTSTKDGDVCSIRIEGTLDAWTLSYLLPALESITAHHARFVIVDLERTILIDSCGASAIVSLVRRIVAEGGEVVVRAYDQPLAVLKVLKLDRILKIDTPRIELSSPSLEHAERKPSRASSQFAAVVPPAAG